MQSAEAASPDIVISQVYGGGGNSGAQLRNDFIELFNRGASPVTVTGWSVQYTSAAGSSWQKTDLTGTIQPGRYYLVQEAAGAGAQPSLPTPDATGSIAMSATAGKVALVTNQTLLACGTTNNCLPNAAIKDFIGFGSAATAFEGTGPTATLSNSTAALRANNGCTDTDNNSSDFTTGAPSPRNSASPTFSCTVTNDPPTITPPANPIATVNQDAPPFTVSLTGSDDGGVYNWSATPGTGVTSVSVSNGQDSANVTYTVTLQSGFNGTATFTASLADNVNPAAEQTVNIHVNDATVNNSPTITPPANPITTVEQNAPPLEVSLNGNDDDSIYNWSATAGTGVSAVSVTAGQGTAGATFNVTLQSGFSGTATFTASLSDNVNLPVAQQVNIQVNSPPPPLDHMVISQIYGGGGNSGATYQNDYVELFNAGNTPFDLGGWTIQYASSTGTSWQTQPLGGVVQPGEYYLISLASGGAVGAFLPVANVSGSINMSGTTGKVALVRGGDPLDGCPSTGADSVVDLVGYGTANCREGASNAPAPSNTTAIFRKNSGYQDTNVNGTDFQTGAPNPRRTAVISEIGPYVLSVDPRNSSTTAPRDLSITANFTESVEVTGGWYDINCLSTGSHNSATVAGSGSFRIITPNDAFQPGEQCTATIFKNSVSDTDTDDGPDNDNLKADYIWSFTIATGASPVYPPTVHLAMGNPNGATADINQPDNYLMEKPEFALSYNRDRGTPNWVSWHLADEWIGSLARVDTFRPDPAVLPEWYRVLHTDYFSSGFDRGHMVPNADRDPETSIPINQATFLMTNMIPQAPGNNQGPWAAQEGYLRTLLPGNELYIVAGGAGIGGTGSNGAVTATIAGGKITVPAFTWKVALVLPKGENDILRVSCSTRTIAVIMPNNHNIANHDWQMYLTSVDAVETLTGYDFYSNLPEPIERCVEAGINGNNPALDTDADDVPDDTDNCDFDVNPDQLDTDNDGAGNACDPDDDNDSVPDTQDAFPLDGNESVDTDGDGIGNNADTDDDNDGQTDADEIACGSNQLDALSKSLDTDGDGRPNCVDTDDDNDGVLDGVDNCPLTPNPDQADFDGDGIGDTCDNPAPTSIGQCMDGGWQTWVPRFKNLGDCIQYVNTRK